MKVPRLFISLHLTLFSASSSITPTNFTPPPLWFPSNLHVDLLQVQPKWNPKVPTSTPFYRQHPYPLPPSLHVLINHQSGLFGFISRTLNTNFPSKVLVPNPIQCGSKEKLNSCWGPHYTHAVPHSGTSGFIAEWLSYLFIPELDHTSVMPSVCCLVQTFKNMTVSSSRVYRRDPGTCTYSSS